MHYIKTYGASGIGGWALKRRFSNFNHRYAITSANLYGLQSMFAGELASQAKSYSPIEAAAERLAKIETSSLVNKMSWFNITNYLIGLLQVEDRTSMAWSLESRVPLLDYRIVEFCMKIPSNIKLKNLQTKYVFRRAIDHILPDAIKSRTDKRGFPTPFNIWFKGPLAGYSHSFVTDEILNGRGLFNSNVAKFFNSNRKYLTPAISRDVLLWPLINIELWYRIFIDGQKPAELNDKISGRRPEIRPENLISKVI